MLNQVILVGRLANDPALRYTANGTAVTEFTLAVERNSSHSKDASSENDADFIPIVAWERLAEVCAEYLSKGRLVALSGRLKLERNKTQDRTYLNPQVVARNVQFLDSNSDSQDNGNNSNQRKDNDQRETSESNNTSDENGIPDNFNNNLSAENDLEDVEVPF